MKVARVRQVRFALCRRRKPPRLKLVDLSSDFWLTRPKPIPPGDPARAGTERGERKKWMAEGGQSTVQRSSDGAVVSGTTDLTGLVESSWRAWWGLT